MAGEFLAFGTDSLARRQLDRVAAEVGVEFTHLTSWAQVEGFESAAAVVIDLGQEGALEFVTALKSRWPLTLVAGYLDLPDRQRWMQAIDAGCDLVTSRGVLARQLSAKLSEWAADPGGFRIRLFSIGDIAGRIGVVARLSDTPAGPLAVYHISGEILVAEDRCPHAGARLSEGEVLAESAVITCPRHGSRFDLRNGERIRGPADDPIRTFRVVIEDTEVFVRLDLPGIAGTP